MPKKTKKTKKCSRCRKTKPINEFYCRDGKSGHRICYCKKCSGETRKEWRHRQFKPNRKYDLKKQHGITPEDYAVILREQKGVCAICSEPETRILRGKVCALSVDHDHETNKIRGLLCSRCNVALGMFRDRPKLLKRAYDYLI